jgi:hypothetical protein
MRHLNIFCHPHMTQTVSAPQSRHTRIIRDLRSQRGLPSRWEGLPEPFPSGKSVAMLILPYRPSHTWFTGPCFSLCFPNLVLAN